MGKYFGTDGFRGKAGVDLTSEHAFKIGRFLGYYYSKYGKKARIVIGKDTRRSSYMYENALAAGIVSSGADAYLLHVTTTPCVSYITREEHFQCGVMISASHNPYYDNGIKLINGDGEKMEDGIISMLEDYIDGTGEEIPFRTDDQIGCTVDYYSGRNRYLGFLTGIVSEPFENRKIALDCANGSAWMLAPALFNALGAKTYTIHNDPNGVNINLDCGSTHIDTLRHYVKDNCYDCGFAFDGDADRCLAVDEKGNLVDGDKIMFICARYLSRNDRLSGNKLVTTVMSNLGLYKALDKIGIDYEKTDVGDRFVYENMKENGYSLGGEQSGHIIFKEYARTGDGLLTALMVMTVMMDTQLPLSVLAEQMTTYPQILTNVIVDDKDATLEDEAVRQAVLDMTDELGDNGRVLLRKSGTEPLLRVMAEASTTEKCQEAIDRIIDSMRVGKHLIKIR